MTGGKLHKGSKVWVQDEEFCWVPGLVKTTEKPKGGGKKLVLVLKASGDDLWIDLKENGHMVEARSVDDFEEFKTVEDLTKLKMLTEPALLEALQQRYSIDKIYTYSGGKVLLAVNPYKTLRGAYGSKQIRRYYDAMVHGRFDSMEPHIYAVAAKAYFNIIEMGGINQTLLVSGESGAGKTESTKFLMRCLTEMSKMRDRKVLKIDEDELYQVEPKPEKKKKPKQAKSVTDRVLQSNPILETFGNASTIRNGNSSRFGKLIKMQFDENSGGLNGVHITSYLLEKSRLTHQFPGERNYHIFYAMAAGGSQEQKDRWRVFDVQSFAFITQAHEVYPEDLTEDRKVFENTVRAMKVLGFSHEEIEGVFDIAAGILHLGNIEFEDFDGNASRFSSHPFTLDSVNASCSLLKLEPKALENALCKRKIFINGSKGAFELPTFAKRVDEVIEKALAPQEADFARDALAMMLYERLFGWIVWRINHGIAQACASEKEEKKKNSMNDFRSSPKGKANPLELEGSPYRADHEIGILDVFGFEVFERNGFEQFCINYCNERLQQVFNEFVLLKEQTEYEMEGIDWTFIKYPDNEACLKMIESKPMGLIALVDENCMYPKGNDHTLCNKMYANLPKRYKHFVKPSRHERADLLFTIQHFAGEVTYNAEGFYKKNKNEFRQEAVDLVNESLHPIVSILLPNDAAACGGGSDMALYFNRKLGGPVGLGTRGNKRGPSKLANNKPQNGSGSPSSKLQQKTVVSHFKTQLDIALDGIRASHAHYVRCLKPNDENEPQTINRPRLVEQLRYSGVMQIIQVAKAGFSTRFTFQEFLERFAILTKQNTPSLVRQHLRSVDEKELKNMCIQVASKARLKEGPDFQLGVTKIFLRQNSFTGLESVKLRQFMKHAIKLQSIARRFLVRVRIFNAAVKLQCVARVKLAKKEVEVRRKQLEIDRIVRIQIQVRRWLNRVRAKKKLEKEKKKQERAEKKKQKKEQKKAAKQRKRKNQTINDDDGDEEERKTSSPERTVPKHVQFNLNMNKVQPIETLVMSPVMRSTTNFVPQPILVSPENGRKQRFPDDQLLDPALKEKLKIVIPSASSSSESSEEESKSEPESETSVEPEPATEKTNHNNNNSGNQQGKNRKKFNSPSPNGSKKGASPKPNGKQAQPSNSPKRKSSPERNQGKRKNRATIRLMVAIVASLVLVPLAFAGFGKHNPLSFLFAAMIGVWIYTHVLVPEDENEKDEAKLSVPKSLNSFIDREN